MVKKIELSSKKYVGYYALVDDEDYEWLNQWGWNIKKNPVLNRDVLYSYRTFQKNKMKKNVYMHRLIMSPPKNMVIDHINGNTLDNRKSNLRIVTKRQNGQNYHFQSASKYPGVYNGNNNKWVARILINNKPKYLGRYDSEIEAYCVYKKACKLIEEDKIDEIESIIKRPKFKSKYVGVNFDKPSGKWRARIGVNNKMIELGFYNTEYEAHLARLVGEKKYRSS